jgi:putative transposase
MCSVLGAKKAGFYAWLRRQPSAREVRDDELRVKVVAIHGESRRRYGVPRVHAKLSELNERWGRKRVARLMREEGLRAKRRKAFVPKTTDSKHEYPIAETLVQRRFSPEEIGAPNRCWAGDITYIRTREGWLYLAVVIDLFSRMVIGWSMSSSMGSRFVLDALEMAIALRGVPLDLIWHSDRGVQYASILMRRLLEKHGIRCSMSAKGDCWDKRRLRELLVHPEGRIVR